MVGGVFGKLGRRYFGWTADAAGTQSRSLSDSIFTQKFSLGKCFFFFLQQQKLPFNPCYGHSWLSKCDFIPASWKKKKKKDADESGSTARPSKHREYSRPTARASGADSLGGRKKTQLRMPQRKEEKNAGGGGGYQEGGSKWSRTVCDSRWSVHIRTGWLQRNPLWAEAEGGGKSHPSSCEKPRKATKCVPGGGVRRDRPHAAHSRTPGMGGLDGRWFLNVSEWWNSSSRPPLEPFCTGRQGRIVESLLSSLDPGWTDEWRDRKGDNRRKQKSRRTND